MRESQPLSVSPDPLPQEPAASGSVAQDAVALWTSSPFIQQVQAWVAAQLAPSGSRLTESGTSRTPGHGRAPSDSKPLKVACGSR